MVNIRPGDYVMIGDMGTNGMGSAFEASFNYYIDACEAMGAKIILNSYSPHGAVQEYAKVYESSTNTFTSYRQDAMIILFVKFMLKEQRQRAISTMQILLDLLTSVRWQTLHLMHM